MNFLKLTLVGSEKLNLWVNPLLLSTITGGNQTLLAMNGQSQNRELAVSETPEQILEMLNNNLGAVINKMDFTSSTKL